MGIPELLDVDLRAVTVPHRVGQRGRKAQPQERRVRGRLPVDQRERELELRQGVATVLVGSNGLPRAADRVVREQVREGRVPEDIADEAGQKAGIKEERASLGRGSSEGDLTSTARIGDSAVVMQPVRLQSDA